MDIKELVKLAQKNRLLLDRKIREAKTPEDRQAALSAKFEAARRFKTERELCEVKDRLENVAEYALTMSQMADDLFHDCIKQMQLIDKSLDDK